MILKKEHIFQLEQLIAEANNITLITHSNPDADTIGSALAFQNILLQL